MTINECEGVVRCLPQEGVVRCLPQSFIWSGIIVLG
jgi:hypothetical protein